MELFLPPESDIIIDAPSVTDWEYEEFFGAVGEQKKFPVPKITIQNQGAQAITRMGCGQYGIVHIINCQDKFVQAINKTARTEIQAMDEWKEVLKIIPSAEWGGTTLQFNMDFHRRKGNISGYLKTTTKEQIMDAMDHQRYIYTGSKTGDWASVRDKKVYRVRTDGRIAPHITAYFKYDINGVWGVNSYGPNNGLFFVQWEIFLNEFFTKYSILDASMSEAIAQYRARK